MNLKIIEQLKESIQQGSTEFINAYVKNEDVIVNEIKNLNGLKSEIYCSEFVEVVDITKFLSIYSDFTSVFLLPHKRNEHFIHYYPADDPLFIIRNITFPSNILNGFIPSQEDILPCYTTQNDKDMRAFYKRLRPLIERNRFLIRPIRTIILNNHPEAKVDRIVYYANSDTKNNDWRIKEKNEEDSFLINNGLNKTQNKLLFEITLPYLSNVSIENLCKITDDETDLLGAFRKALKDVMIESIKDDMQDISIIRNDIIRPQIETINRKFKTITNVHKLSIGAALTGYTISLFAISLSAHENFNTIFSATAGALAAGFLASEVRRQSEEDKLKDNPYFLLLKISKSSSTKILKQF